MALEPNNARAWMLKGSLGKTAHRPDAALSDLERAVTLDPALIDARIERVNLLLQMGRVEPALRAARDLAAEQPSRVDVLYVLAVALNKSGDEQTATAILRKARDSLDRVPQERLEKHPPSLLLSALLHYSLKEWEKALAQLETYLRIDPTHAGARKMAGSIWLAQDQAAKAVEVLEPAFGLDSDDVGLLTLLGDAYSRVGRHYRAAELLDKAVGLAPDNAESRAKRALNNLSRGQEDSAIRDLEQVFESAPQAGEIGVRLYLVHLARDAYAAAIETAHKLITADPENLTYLNLLATAQARSGATKQARASYEQSLTLEARYLPALIGLGKLDYLEGAAQRAETSFRGLLEQYPDAPEIMAELAYSLDAQGKTAEAVDWLQKAVAKAPDQRDALGALVRALIREKRLDEALSVARQAEVRAPNDLTVLEALGRAHLALGRKTTAESILRNMSKIAGYEAKALYRTAVLQSEADDVKGAIWSLEKATEQRPDFLQARLLLVELLVKDAKSDKALEQAETIGRLFAESATGPLLAGNLSIRAGRLEDAFGYFTAAEQRGDHLDSALGFARIQVLRKQHDGALETLERLRRSYPDNRKVREMLAGVHLQMQDWDKARSEYEYVVAIDAGDVVAYNNLAFIYAMQDNPKAIDYATKALALALAPKSGSVNDTLGWILIRAGRIPEGLKHLRNAVTLEPDNPEIRYHLGVALHQLGKDTDARKELERSLGGKTRHPWTEDAAALLAKIVG